MSCGVEAKDRTFAVDSCGCVFYLDLRHTMPLPEKYRREQIDNRAASEREARRESRRAWIRILGEIVFWTLLGLGGFGLAFHTFDYDLGRIYWWAGSVVWVAGVTAAVFSAHRRGEERGDW